MNLRPQPAPLPIAPPSPDPVNLRPLEFLPPADNRAAVCLSARQAGDFLLDLQAMLVAFKQQQAVTAYYRTLSGSTEGKR